jgi:D-xylonolactonase
MTRVLGTAHCVWDVRATLGEGPIWCADEAAIWFVDIKQQRVHRFDSKLQRGQSWAAPEQAGFIAAINERSFVVGLKTGLHRFDSASGEFKLLREVESTQPGNRLNDGYVDARGRLWFGSMDDNEQEPTGAMYRFDGNNVVCIDRGICITNGPCVSPDGLTFYYTDTVNRAMYAFDLNDDGSLRNKRVFTRFEASEGNPDGSVIDSEACIWTAMWGGWGLLRLSPQGERIGKIAVPCSNVTKAVFGGHDLKTLYITTAQKGLSVAELAEQPLAGGLFSIDVNVQGLPSNKLKLEC